MEVDGMARWMAILLLYKQVVFHFHVMCSSEGNWFKLLFCLVLSSLHHLPWAATLGWSHLPSAIMLFLSASAWARPRGA